MNKLKRIYDKLFKYNNQQNTINNLLNQIYNLQSQVQDLEKEKNAFKKFVPKDHLELLEFHIVEHCNLNCKSCVHFSPLADEEFLDIETFKSDIKRMSKLTNGYVEKINIFGGEPLLHPDLINFLKIPRKFFEKSRIQLVTNGILLPSQNDEFWEICHENSIIISMTNYPININHDLINEKANEFNVKIESFSGDKKNSQWHFPLDLDGNQDKILNFKKCQEANHCSNVYKGKFFICPIASNMRHFNKFFNKHVLITEKDYIDIYEVENIEEIFMFSSKPSPICSYCNVKDRTFDHSWGLSKKEIEEWILK